MLTLFVSWLVQTSIMPLFVGGVTGALAPVVWGSGCRATLARRLLLAGGAAWLLHLALVGSGLLREGSIWDYAAVMLAGTLASAAACRAERKIAQ
ncbi:hypothetical protein [Thiomonas bhubaneswarensis]|uniref:Uncharacterized protein n=1 Tax=Thiomonas bhubaneswarensis TaxID=339866 RepID=A0A0K6HQV6_9BURK|nr:hypothetical protein [Thiomonas bhubaneswarensis]CUA93259.1 hypothetical protein Ga0061069_101164 [Thiomonas bhubaneswarensis]